MSPKLRLWPFLGWASVRHPSVGTLTMRASVGARLEPSASCVSLCLAAQPPPARPHRSPPAVAFQADSEGIGYGLSRIWWLGRVIASAAIFAEVACETFVAQFPEFDELVLF